MHRLMDKEKSLDNEKQRLYGLAVWKMVCLTRSTGAQRSRLRHKVIELMDKATRSSLAAEECRRQFNDACTALAECREQLVAKLDAVASNVRHDWTKAWDPVQTSPGVYNVTEPLDVFASTLPHSSVDEHSRNDTTFGNPRRPRRCLSWPRYGWYIPAMVAKGADELSTASIVEGGNSVSSPSSEQPVCSTTIEEAWPGSSNDADTISDDSSEDNTRGTAASKPIAVGQDDDRILRDCPSSMHAFRAKDGSIRSEGEHIDDDYLPGDKTTDDRQHSGTDVDTAKSSPTSLHHNINTVSLQPDQEGSERTGTAQQPMLPDRPAPANVSAASKHLYSGCDRSEYDDYLRTLPPVELELVKESTNSESVHAQCNAEHARADKVNQGGSQQSISKSRPKRSERESKAEAMAGSWRTVGGKAPQRGPSDSTRKGG